MEKWLFVGLGNQGKKYARTRHNLGIEVLRAWLAQLPTLLPGSSVTAWHEVSALSAMSEGTIAIGDTIQKISALFPLTNMNASGEAVAAAMRAQAVAAEKVIVIHDDIELPFGEVKLVTGKSAAGHNGVRSIHQALGNTDVARLRLGIGRPNDDGEVKDFVLMPFTTEEQTALAPLISKATTVLLQVVSAEGYQLPAS